MVSICPLGSAVFAEQVKGAPPPTPPPPTVLPSYISGWVFLPDEAQHKAEGIEVRVMICVGECPSGKVGSGGAFAVEAGTSVFTEADGRFNFNESNLGLIAPNSFSKLYLNVVLDGYAELMEEVHCNSANDYLHSAGNVLMLNRGPSDGINLTRREPMPLTRVEALREELVKQYNELSVREYEQGLRDMLNHKDDSAIGHFKKAAQAAPAFYDAWIELGSVQKEAKHLDEAAQTYRRAAAVSPNSGEPLIGLGAVLLDQAGALQAAGDEAAASAKYSDAAGQLQQAIGKAPWSSDAYYYLGSALYKLNHLPEAEGALKTALDKINPTQDARLMLVNLFIKQKRYQEALDQLDGYLAAVSDSPQRPAAEQMQASIRKALQPQKPPQQFLRKRL